jgi:hypothetical protein
MTTHPNATLSTDYAKGTEHTITPTYWFTSERNGAHAFWAVDFFHERFSVYINAADTWALPLVGRTDLPIKVKVYKFHDDGYFKSDLLKPADQTVAVQKAIAAVAEETPKAPKAPKKAAKPSRQRLGRNVQSGACKSPAERAEPLKWSALVNNVGESNRIWRQWEAFQEATDNEIGLSSFVGMCILEGLDSVVAKYKA